MALRYFRLDEEGKELPLTAEDRAAIEADWLANARASLLRETRARRNRLLAESDIAFTRVIEDEQDPAALKVYRQALRDLPQVLQADVALAGATDWDSALAWPVPWPAKPE